MQSYMDQNDLAHSLPYLLKFSMIMTLEPGEMPQNHCSMLTLFNAWNGEEFEASKVEVP
jgi:hypothetical protein